MMRALRRGDRGPDVTAVQQGLNLALKGQQPAITTFGFFGPQTDGDVRFFQRSARIADDGIVGPVTRAKLFPLKVVTVVARGMRLRMPSLGGRGIRPPNLGPGPLVFPGLPGSQPPPGLTPNLMANVVRFTDLGPAKLTFQPQKFPRLQLPLAGPPTTLPPLTLPPLTLPPPIPLPSPVPQILQDPLSALSLNTHHFELAPATQVSVGKSPQFAFTLALQAVVMIGNEKRGHQEFASGVQVQTPPAPDGGDWTVGYFAQITDVDRLGAGGQFHFWQPYAQIGIQNSTGSFKPQVAGSLFPVNLTMDVGESIGINIAGGLALTYDTATGTIQAGAQMQAGIVVKLGQ